MQEKHVIASALDLVEDKRRFDMKVLTSLVVEDLELETEEEN